MPKEEVHNVVSANYIFFDRWRKTVGRKVFIFFKAPLECIHLVNLTVRQKCVRRVALLPRFLGEMPICMSSSNPHFLPGLVCREG
jgi:hypothetical protein